MNGHNLLSPIESFKRTDDKARTDYTGSSRGRYKASRNLELWPRQLLYSLQKAKTMESNGCLDQSTWIAFTLFGLLPSHTNSRIFTPHLVLWQRWTKFTANYISVVPQRFIAIFQTCIFVLVYILSPPPGTLKKPRFVHQVVTRHLCGSQTTMPFTRKSRNPFLCTRRIKLYRIGHQIYSSLVLLQFIATYILGLLLKSPSADNQNLAFTGGWYLNLTRTITIDSITVIQILTIVQNRSDGLYDIL